MKTLEFENCGLQEMNALEMKSVDGGNAIVKWIVDYLIGKLVDNIPEAISASCQVKSEGGTLCSDMPFK